MCLLSSKPSFYPYLFMVILTGDSLWKNQKAIDAIPETYELDLTLDVWNSRAVSLLPLATCHLPLATYGSILIK